MRFVANTIRQSSVLEQVSCQPTSGVEAPSVSLPEIIPVEQIQDCKVLFLIDRMSEMGGAELALARLVQDLSAQAIRLYVITFCDDICSDLRDLFPCPIVVLPLSRTYTYEALRVAWTIRSLIIRQQIRLVHTFFETSDLFGGLIARSVPGVALVTSRRDMGILRRPKHRMAYLVLSRLAHRVVAVSDRVRAWCIMADRLPEGRVVTIYNGVKATPGSAEPGSTSQRSSIRKDLGLLPEQIVVVAVGHIRHVKGYDVLLQAAALVLESFPDTVFLVAGAEHEEGRLEQLLAMASGRSLGERVRFLGEVSDIPSLLTASDIFILPSRSEGFSNALIEAMGAGLPCVATAVGGNAEALLHGVSGFIVPPEDPEEMSNALVKMISSADLRRKMGDEGRWIVKERFTHAAMTTNMLTVYRGALRDVGYFAVEGGADAQGH